VLISLFTVVTREDSNVLFIVYLCAIVVLCFRVEMDLQWSGQLLCDVDDQSVHSTQ